MKVFLAWILAFALLVAPFFTGGPHIFRAFLSILSVACFFCLILYHKTGTVDWRKYRMLCLVPFSFVLLNAGTEDIVGMLVQGDQMHKIMMLADFCWVPVILGIVLWIRQRERAKALRISRGSGRLEYGSRLR